MRPQILNSLFTSINSLNGVGDRTYSYLTKLLGGNRIKDVLFLQPSNVIDRRYSPKIKDAEIGKICTLEIEVVNHEPNSRYKKVYSVMCRDETGFMYLTFFKPHTKWLESQLPIGEKRIVSGKLEKFGSKLQMSHPDFIEKIENRDKIQTVEAVYPLTAGLSRKILSKVMNQAITKVPDLPEWNDVNLIKKRKWLSFKDSLLNVHSPSNLEDIENNTIAKDRLAYDEVLAMQLALAYIRHNTKAKSGISIDGGINEFLRYRNHSPLEGESKSQSDFGGGHQQYSHKYSNQALDNAKELRNNTTEAEKLLWYYIKNEQLGCKFRRQQPIGDFIVDFACLEKNIVIELDGSQHNEADKIKKDKKRTDYLEKSDFTVIRFWNNEIFKNMSGCLTRIKEYLSPHQNSNAILTPPQGGSDNSLIHLKSVLPFSLTNAQERAIEDIFTDMKSPSKMMRLLQGDVGSGKTIVALFACINATSAGYQSCIMAPTEILARQHYETISKLCSEMNINTVLLTGRDKGKPRQEKLELIQSGEAKIVIGTHALFQESVDFGNLGLAVIDEQHRFGVHQRMMLSEKGSKVDCLVMSATPIPRTLTLTLYGDMDISILDEKPANRKEIQTSVLNSNKLESLIYSLEDRIKEGEKIYWVCPLVEESEKLDLAAATERYQDLRKYFGDIVGLVHGKMKSDEKKAAMDDFLSGKTKILVATTVIEVGVDVKDASIMVIEHSERFGLSQLHQLRGRVGRGDKQSYCVLVYSYPISTDGRKRLEIMRKTNDGFVIAEEDLSIRGGGEILGTRQSGIPEFKFASYSIHRDLFDIARQDAKLIVERDSHLTSERGQALKVLLYLFEQDLGIKYLGN